MMDRQRILGFAANDQERFLLSHALDAAFGNPGFTSFLDPAQHDLVVCAVCANVNTDYMSFGGYKDAERRIISFSNYSETFPIKAVAVRPNKPNEITHRDYLGSIMALGIERNRVGDICVFPNEAVVFVHDSVAGYIVDNLTRVASTGAAAEVVDVAEFVYSKNEGTIIKGTVASLRIDAVTALGFGVSRENAQKLINGQKVMVNHRLVKSVSIGVCQDDVISVRGVGRGLITKVGGTSRKNRIFIEMKVFL